MPRHTSSSLLTPLGTLDELVRETGQNNKDGWLYSRHPDDDRRPAPTRKPRRRPRALLH